jgi:hypothetical protein
MEQQRLQDYFAYVILRSGRSKVSGREKRFGERTIGDVSIQNSSEASSAGDNCKEFQNIRLKRAINKQNRV